MNNTKETIGPRGTVAGFRPLIGEERWHRDDFTAEKLEGGWRPLLPNEIAEKGDERSGGGHVSHKIKGTLGNKPSDFSTLSEYYLTKRPLPPPQVETFEAHGHVWYRHVPGDAEPLERQTLGSVDVLLRNGDTRSWSDGPGALATWGDKVDSNVQAIGYRFPDFPAVHTPLQQEQPCVQPVIRGVGPYKAMKDVEKTMQSFQQEQPEVQQQFRTKKRLLDMYHGWCDVAPDSVAECIADVAKVLYPTDAERCEAAFQKWLDQCGHPGMDVGNAGEAWNAAWSAAKQQKP